MMGRGLYAMIHYLWRRKWRVMTLVFGLAFAASLGWWQMGLSIDDVPLWGWVAAATALVTLPYAVMVASIVVGLIYDPDRVVLVEVDPADGDVAVHDISPETYEDLVVVDARGQEIGRGHLHHVDALHAREAYEVASYDPEANVAEVSWMGEASNSAIRRHESMLEQVRETLSPLARAYSDLHAQVDLLVEERVSDAMNSMLGVVEGVELPPGQQIHDQFASEAGREELEQLPEPEETLHQLEEPTRREGGPALEEPAGGEPTQPGEGGDGR